MTRKQRINPMPLPHLTFEKWLFMPDVWVWTPGHGRPDGPQGDIPPQHVRDLVDPWGTKIVTTGPGPEYKVLSVTSMWQIFPIGWIDPDYE